MKRKSNARKFSGFLDSCTILKGELRFEGTVRVDGELEGTVSTPDVFIVGPSAKIRANVSAGSVQVHGEVLGDICCTNRVELCAGGRITGTIHTPSLLIEAGSTFDGESRMAVAQASKPPIADAHPETLPESHTALSIPAHLTEEETLGDEQPPTRWKGLRKQLESVTLRGFTPETPDHD